MGGDLSIRLPKNKKPVIFIGQDETIFRQYSFSSKTWHKDTGETKLLPKTDGYTSLVSAFVSRPFGLGIHLTPQQLHAINNKRSREHYVSKDCANEINGTTKKKITGYSPIGKVF